MNRYPGIRSFDASNQHLFHGRKQEKRELLQLIVLNNLVVLFGKSGIGKTSLLQAGVCPDLEGRSLHSVTIRVNNTEFSPQHQVYLKLLNEQYIPEQTNEGLSLWEYFKKFWFVDAGEVLTPVFIFDQFEELFTLYSWEERRNFITELADVINGRMPKVLRGQLEDKIRGNPTVEGKLQADWASRPNVKIVLSIRSDFLYLLDELSAEIPSILRCRFQLKPLGKTNATNAIVFPAALEGDYDSPVFSYSPEALENIIGVLGEREVSSFSLYRKSAEPEIEAFQLQLLCQRIEEKIIAEKKQTGFVVTSQFYGSNKGIDEIISRFYSGIIAGLASESQLPTEKLLGKGLIKNGRRIIMEEAAILEEFGIDRSILHYLESKRLLKKEARKGTFYYEISHDTLIDPVLERYRVIEEEEKRKEREAELETERRKRRRAIRLALTGFALLAISVIALAIVFWQSKQLKAKTFHAQQQLAENYKLEGKYTQALTALDTLLIFSKEFGNTDTEWIEKLKTDWAQAGSHIQKGKNYKAEEAYGLALLQYDSAYQVSPDENINNERANVRKLRRELYNLKMTDGNSFKSRNNIEEAIKAYQDARDQIKTDTVLAELKAVYIEHIRQHPNDSIILKELRLLEQEE